MIPQSDAQWKKFGKTEPYWAVLTSDEYLSENMTPENKESFFESGAHHVDKLKLNLESRFNVDFSPNKTLDFGCGVGRIAVNLATVSSSLLCMDISPEMLQESEKNCKERGFSDVSFALSSDRFEGIEESFDFIHCYLVLQHINPRRGYFIISRLLDMLESDGLAAIQFPIRGPTGKNGVIRKFLKTWVPFSHNLYNLIEGKRFSDPYMETHHYDLGKIIEIARERGMNQFSIDGTIDNSGTLGLFLFIKNA